MDEVRCEDILWDSSIWQGALQPLPVVTVTNDQSPTADAAVRQALAAENAELRDALASVRTDVETYRRMVQDLLTRLQTLAKENADQREQMWIWRRDRATEQRKRA